MSSDDIISILAAAGDGDSGDLGFRSGTVTAWNVDTGANTIVVRGVPMTDLPSLATSEILSTQVGDTVGLLKVKTQYFILGKISTDLPTSLADQIEQLQQQLDLLLAGDVDIGGVLSVTGALNVSGPVRFSHPIMAITQTEDGTDITSISSTSFTAGSPVCGFAFRVPPSGVIDVRVSGHVAQRLGGQATALSYQINTGSVVGSGTPIFTGSFNRSVRIGRVVNADQAVEVNASYVRGHGGFTPYAAMNIFTVHAVSGGSHGDVFQRGISIVPIP
jgi:hypothetical protein